MPTAQTFFQLVAIRKPFMSVVRQLTGPNPSTIHLLAKKYEFPDIYTRLHAIRQRNIFRTPRGRK
jgi:hypothetical protein